MTQVRIGTSGWVYKHWTSGLFYPPKLPSRQQLAFYTQYFDTVEINYSYYQLPERSAFQTWRSTVPNNFVFAVKASRYLTHMKKLKDPAEPLERFFERASALEDCFGPVLFQFPKQWRINLPRLEAFLEALCAYPGHRWTFEFRHPTWLVDEVYRLLGRSNAALCQPVGWGVPLDVRLTADWTYIRFHAGQHGTGFEDAELRPWAERIRAYAKRNIDSYCYFNNDSLWHGRPAAIDDARRL